MDDIHEFENKTDEEIVELVPQDKEFFGALIRRYEGKLTRYVRRIGGGTKEAVEDVVQNIFIKVYVNLKSFRRGQKFSSWLYGIAHNECIDYWRRNKRHNSISLDENTELASVLATDENIEEDLFKKEERAAVQKILSRLPIKFKEVLVLRYLEDKDYQEISDILKKPVSTVGTLIHRAKAQLKKLVKDT
ncbi:MAG: RNA polymerase sigma factor [Candidatus Moranbacteria bacterium]|nr:RNA polymerase sigma factor [Candidatus Moranbacteria bacterium]